MLLAALRATSCSWVTSKWILCWVEQLALCPWTGPHCTDRKSAVQPPAHGQVPLRHVATPENYILYGAAVHVDDDEVREAVEKLLLGDRAPPALLKVVGRAAYDR